MPRRLRLLQSRKWRTDTSWPAEEVSRYVIRRGTLGLGYEGLGYEKLCDSGAETLYPRCS